MILQKYIESTADHPQFSVAEPRFPEAVFDIREYGAAEGGDVSNTEAFRRAVADCHTAGGGRVLVPAGEWLTGPISLLGRVDLHLEKNAKILFSTDPAEYLPPVFTRWEGVECYNYSPLIYAIDAEDIAVTGEGKFLGGGEAWWGWKENQVNNAWRVYNAEHEGVPVAERVYGDGHCLRPSFFQPIRCKRVLIEDAVFENGPMWTLHPVYCEDVTVRNVTVHTEGPNTDGLNPDSCDRVMIEGCSFSTGDDCIALNSGINEDGRRVARPCRNIIVRDCVTYSGHGGMVIGSAVSGGVENVYVSGLKCIGTQRAIRLKSMRGRGGYIRNVHIGNVAAAGIPGDIVLLTMHYNTKMKPNTEMPSEFRNIVIRDVRGDAHGAAVRIRGIPESPLQNVRFVNLDLRGNSGLVCEDAKDLTIINSRITSSNSPAWTLNSVEGLRVEDGHTV